MSSFNGTDCFGSGPHEFSVGPRGLQWATKLSLGTVDGGIDAVGEHTLTVEVRGRLVASSAAALGTLAGTLESLTSNKGDLVDDTGRTWEAIRMLEVVYDGPATVGRVWSVGYRVLFAAI